MGNHDFYCDFCHDSVRMGDCRCPESIADRRRIEDARERQQKADREILQKFGLSDYGLTPHVVAEFFRKNEARLTYLILEDEQPCRFFW